MSTLNGAMKRFMEVGNDLLGIQYTGQYDGKSVYSLRILGSRAAGWSSTSAFGDACEYLHTSL